MAHRLWAVFSSDAAVNPFMEVGRDRFIVEEHANRNWGIFYDPQSAERFAKELSQRNPGMDIQVLAATHGFHSPPATKITTKQWNDNGEYTPL